MAPLRSLTTAAAALGLFACQCSAEFFYRLGACPKLGCILPPDQADFLPGQYFDIRVEVHAPQNGSERITDDSESISIDPIGKSLTIVFWATPRKLFFGSAVKNTVEPTRRSSCLSSLSDRSNAYAIERWNAARASKGGKRTRGAA